MKFTILSHAGLLVESSGTRLVVDPWLVGSCYWRSWWNYPAVPEFAKNIEELDYIYLTHMHWDHFHGPSLDRLPKSATILIPKAHFRRMHADASMFGFRDVVELPHGKKITLKNGLTVASYQYGLFTDSVLAISDGKTTLLDMNDAKIRDRSFAQLTDAFPRVDFLFRSHSSASAYPFCVEFEEPESGIYRKREDYMSEFVDTARLLSVPHAIPFASSHCYLHRDTIKFNSIAVTPRDVHRYFDEHGPEGSECVEMVAGDSWSDTSGFEISDRDFFSNRAEIIEEYLAEYTPKLEAGYAQEDRAEVSFEAFREYFQAQVDSVPRLSRILFRALVIFEVKNRTGAYWVIDFDRRTVYETNELPEQYACKVTVPALVLRDCIEKHMFATFSASKHLSILIKKGGHKDYLIFFQLLDMFEYEYFPVRQLFRWRFITVWLRRWRELLEYAALARRIAFRPKGSDPLDQFVAKIDRNAETGSGQ